MFYALTDYFTGNHPFDYCAGFAETKMPIAFHTKAQRDKWLSETKLTTARALTRKQALKWVASESGYHWGYTLTRRVKVIQIYGGGDKVIPV